jgi:hypothetical protein
VRRRAPNSRQPGSPTPVPRSVKPKPAASPPKAATEGRSPASVDRRMESLQAFLRKEQSLAKRPVREREWREVPVWMWPSLAGVGILIGIVLCIIADTSKETGESKPDLTASVSEPSLAHGDPEHAGNAHPGKSLGSATVNPAPRLKGEVDTNKPAATQGLGGAQIASVGRATCGVTDFRTFNTDSGSSSNDKKSGSAGQSAEEAGTPATSSLSATDLSGWEDPKGAWHVQQQMLVAAVGTGAKTLAVLRSKEKYADFDLKFRVRLKDGSDNCGVRFRSPAELPVDGTADGVECVIHRTVRGKAYGIGSLAKGSTDEPDVVSARGSAARFTKAADFNQVQIRCEGKNVVIRVNHLTTFCKTIPAIPDKGYIALELDARHQAGEVEFKDLKFTDLTNSTDPQSVARRSVGSNSIAKGEAHYFESVDKARTKLVATFEAAIKQRGDSSSNAMGSPSGMLAILEQEKDAFLKKDQIPWSKPMRAAMEDYIHELENAQQRIEKAFEEEIRHAKGRNDQPAIVQLKAAEDAFLAPHLVGIAAFDGTRLRFRSDGIVENSKDQTVRRWWLSRQQPAVVFLERKSDSDDETAEHDKFRIADDGKSLVQSRDGRPHIWEFVHD